jgi:hypothetical protein
MILPSSYDPFSARFRFSVRFSESERKKNPYCVEGRERAKARTGTLRLQ